MDQKGEPRESRPLSEAAASLFVNSDRALATIDTHGLIPMEKNTTILGAGHESVVDVLTSKRGLWELVQSIWVVLMVLCGGHKTRGDVLRWEE